MKYLLKYELTSKYLDYHRYQYQEFDDLGELIDFILEYWDYILNWKVYKELEEENEK